MVEAEHTVELVMSEKPIDGYPAPVMSENLIGRNVRKSDRGLSVRNTLVEMEQTAEALSTDDRARARR